MTSARPPEASRGGVRGVLIWLAFALPLAWTGMTLAVATHEVIGHASSAVHAGYEVCHVRVGLDGTGVVVSQYLDFRAEPPADPRYGQIPRVAIGLGGVISTAIVGAILVCMALLLRRRTFLSCALLIVGLAHLLDGPTYLLGDLMVPGRGGDIDAILRTAPDGVNRLPLAILGAVGLVGVGLFVSVQLHRRVEDRFGPLSRAGTLVLAAGLVPILAFVPLVRALHPWEYPGKWLPFTALVAVQAVAGAFCVLRPATRAVTSCRPPAAPWPAVMGGWIATVVVAGAVVLTGAHRGIDFAPSFFTLF